MYLQAKAKQFKEDNACEQWYSHALARLLQAPLPAEHVLAAAAQTCQYLRGSLLLIEAALLLQLAV